MDTASEKILLDIPIGREHGAHSPIVLPGGVPTFDSYGDLYIAVGANADLGPSVNEKYRDLSAEASSSNMADLRGSILRIHPDNSAKGYRSPRATSGPTVSGPSAWRPTPS